MQFDEAGVRRRGWAAIAVLAVLSCALLAPTLASAETFFVDSVSDAVDTDPGDGGCLTAGGKCSLRAAIEEATASAESDQIRFEEAPFDGQVAGTIVLAASLPPIPAETSINGECSVAENLRPCVGVSGPAGAAALIVKEAGFVEIEGLVVGGAQVGIDVEESGGFRIRGNWLGVTLAGAAAANGTGVRVGPGSGGRVGGEGPGTGNLFANNSGQGIAIRGASGIEVLGNRFGIAPGGASAANGEAIEVTSVAPSGPQATGNLIGTRIRPQGVASPACDFGCNTISGSTAGGIDLQGDGGGEAPAVATIVAGNYLGLDAAGASAPNAGPGILVGTAPQTVVGGRKAGDANRFSGGTAAVLAGPAAADLVIRGNAVGLDGSGGSAAAPDDGFLVNSEGLSSPALEATILANELRMEGGAAIAQQGLGARITGNAISGANLGIRVSGSSGVEGNLIEANAIDDSGADGIRIESDLNEVFGNRITGAGGAGIAVRGSSPFGVSGNLIGGDQGAEENEIVGAGSAAIVIENVEGTMNEVARNHGTTNGGSFIELLANLPGTEPNGPNGGIAPPPIAVATPSEASGAGAEAGATVRVFRKRIASPGELESTLGEALVDPEGNWRLAYAVALAPGTVVAATQTNEAGGTSELATATTATDGATADGGAAGAAGPGASNLGDVVPPRTAILKAPKPRAASTTARFEFDSDELGTNFQCKLDRKPFRPCSSPKRYAGLRLGKHRFQVRAVDAAGNADRTPAKRSFTVVGKR